MKLISKQVDYAIEWLVTLAKLPKGESLSVRLFADDRSISRLFLQKITGELRKAGVVVASRGARGGYRLAVDPQYVTLGEIIALLESPKAMKQCKPDCLVEKPKPIIVKLEQEMLRSVGRYSLAKMVSMNE